MELEKLSCDSYSTTEDKRTLLELGYDVVVKIDGNWVIKNDLKGKEPHTFHSELQKERIYSTNTKNGYMTEDRYRQYINKLYKRKHIE